MPSVKNKGPAPTGSFWKEEQQKAFQQMQEELSSAQVLAFVDFSKPFILETDASQGGLAASSNSVSSVRINAE